MIEWLQPVSNKAGICTRLCFSKRCWRLRVAWCPAPGQPQCSLLQPQLGCSGFASVYLQTNDRSARCIVCTHASTPEVLLAAQQLLKYGRPNWWIFAETQRISLLRSIAFQSRCSYTNVQSLILMSCTTTWCCFQVLKLRNLMSHALQLISFLGMKSGGGV